MLLHRVVGIEQLADELPVLFPLDAQLVSLLLDGHDLLTFFGEDSLELNHSPLKVGFLLLALLEFPLDPVDQVLPWPHGLELVVPLHAVPFKCLDASPVISKDLSQVHALVRLL